MNNFSLFFLGCILGSIVGVITGIALIIIDSNKQKYARKCLNCRHCIPWESKEGMTKLYCDFALNNNISTFPVREYGCCGHFELTEELKAEQVKDKAEKMVKIKN